MVVHLLLHLMRQWFRETNWLDLMTADSCWFPCVNPQRKNLPPHSALKLRAYPVMGHGPSLFMWEWPPRRGMQPILIRSLSLPPDAPQQVPIRADP